jgi:NAD(P)-dependent dehydrogenase (short-subunit alcohol dehydrogenase family)
MSTDHGGEGGTIINLSSQVARFGGNQLLSYAASKGAIESFTIGLAREVAHQGIRVNAVSPGIIATGQHLLSDPDAVHQVSVEIPLHRLGTPKEVADAILWLASDKAAYITGVVLPVAGGR